MKKGFTLIELLVVIAIIAMLSSLSVVALNSARAKSRDARRLSDIKQIRTALEMYYDNNQSYPGGTNTELGSTTAACFNSISGFTSATNCPATVYMQIVPKDPMANTGAKYVYTQNGSGATYTIEYKLEGAATTSKAGPESMGYSN
ncbi:MAG TPA: prepilin-type N-terminal cleavage/methylation domain-containing protein [bacterium]|nr:prepilin-type N-terminal cleavage/methylation domain-containing protein [bacterium]